MARGSDKRGLGRGLSALMADIEPAASVDNTAPTTQSPTRADRMVPIDAITPNPNQPRQSFPQTAMDELAASIREKGIIQPLILRSYPAGSSKYEIVAGERRWRAAQMARLHEVPALIREFTDTEVLEVAIIENIQRADLNPMEEAHGYRQLVDRFGHSQENLAKAMGKSRSHLANTMRLLNLPDEIQEMLRNGKISAGHARALLTADDPITLARRAVSDGLSVRDVERAAKSVRERAARPASARRNKKDADTRILESDLSAALGMSVVIDHDAHAGGGKLSIKYKDLSQLDDLMRLLHTN